MTRSTAATLLLLFCCFGLLTMSGIAQTSSTKEAPEGAELYMDNYSLYVNRQLVVQNGGLGGKVLWFCLPEQGQFIHLRKKTPAFTRRMNFASPKGDDGVRLRRIRISHGLEANQCYSRH